MKTDIKIKNERLIKIDYTFDKFVKFRIIPRKSYEIIESTFIDDFLDKEYYEKT